jgi:hypothetical protein
MKLRAPPADLNDRPLPLVSVASDFWRIWNHDYSSAFFWSQKGLYRFDSKSARYGILYTGFTLEAAVVEVFGDRWLDTRLLSVSLASRYEATCFTGSSSSVVDTTGPELNRLGVDSMLFASTDYRLTRRWARAFMEHPCGASGILYHSRKNPILKNCAFFGCPNLRLFRETLSCRLLNCPGFDAVLDRYGIALV